MYYKIKSGLKIPATIISAHALQPHVLKDFLRTNRGYNYDNSVEVDRYGRDHACNATFYCT